MQYPVTVDDLVVIRLSHQEYVIAQVTSTKTVTTIDSNTIDTIRSLEVAWGDVVMEIPPRISAIAQKAALLPEAGKMIGHSYPSSEDAINSLRPYIRSDVAVEEVKA